MAFCKALHQFALFRRCHPQNNFEWWLVQFVLLSFSHKITGATAILLFYTWLPDKTLRLTPNKGVSLVLFFYFPKSNHNLFGDKAQYYRIFFATAWPSRRWAKRWLSRQRRSSFERDKSSWRCLRRKKMTSLKGWRNSWWLWERKLMLSFNSWSSWTEIFQHQLVEICIAVESFTLWEESTKVLICLDFGTKNGGHFANSGSLYSCNISCIKFEWPLITSPMRFDK